MARGCKRQLAALWVLILVLVVGAPAYAAAPAPAHLTAPGHLPGPRDVTVTITSITPTVLTPGTPLQVSATLTNNTTTPIEGAVARLRVTQLPMQTRSQVWAWSDNDPTTPGLAGSIMVPVEITEALAPGQVRALTFTLPADSLATGQLYWGPHALAVEMVQGNTRLGIARSFTLWNEGTRFQPTAVTVLVPVEVSQPVSTTAVELSPTAVSPALTAAAATQAAVQARLELASAAKVAVLVDPTTIAEGGSLAGTPAGADLTAALAKHEVYVAPAGDPDVAALARAKQPGWITAGLQASATALLQVRPSAKAPALLAPSTGLLDSTVIQRLSAVEATLVAAPGELAPVSTVTYTPSGLTTVEGTRVAVPDAHLSGYLAAASLPPAQQAMLMAAELMVVTGELPNRSRHLLISAGAGASSGPTAAAARASLAILSTLPWVRVAPLAELLSSTPDTTERTALSASPAADTGLDPQTVTDLLQARTQVANLASATSNPAAYRDQFETHLRQILSQQARSQLSARTSAIEEARKAAAHINDLVTLLPGSQITQLSSEAELPVVISNTAPFPLTLTVRLTPDSPRLTAAKDVVVTVSAASQYTVRVPVSAATNGEYDIGVELLAPNGAVLTHGDPIFLNVQAQWDIIITSIAAVGSVIVLVFGLYRTLRSRRGTRAEQIAAAHTQDVTVDDGAGRKDT